MKIGILTFHCAINYGAVLQAYGLQVHLESLGHEVYIIDYRPEYLTEFTRLFRFNKIPFFSIKQITCDFLRECMVIPIRFRRQNVFRVFRNKHLRQKNIKLNVKNSEFDVFVFGSDQIWNPVITNGYDNVYFGNFKAAEGKMRISYAASCGSINNIRNKKTLRNLLSDFSSVSVREKTFSNFLVNICPHLSVHTCLDPVLLAGRKKYDNVIEDFCAEKKYLLLFQLHHDELLFQNAQELSKDNNLELIEVTSYTESLKNKCMVNVVSPGKLLAYIKNATYVITNSYHGVVLSLLYQKNFNAICRDGGNAERIIDLLESLHLTERAVQKVSTLSEIDFSNIEILYKELLFSSREYISNALSYNE